MLFTFLIATYFMATPLEDWQAGKQKDIFHRALKVTVSLQHAHIFCYFGQMFFLIPTSLPNLKNGGAVLTMYVYVFLYLLLIFWSPPWKAGRLGNRRIFFTEPFKVTVLRQHANVLLLGACHLKKSRSCYDLTVFFYLAQGHVIMKKSM